MTALHQDGATQKMAQETQEVEGLGFSLLFAKGQAVLRLHQRAVVTGVQVQQADFLVPGLQFPLDVTGGADRFQGHRLSLQSLVLDFDLHQRLDSLLHREGGLLLHGWSCEAGVLVVTGQMGDVAANDFVAHCTVGLHHHLNLVVQVFDVVTFGDGLSPTQLSERLVRLLGAALFGLEEDVTDSSHAPGTLDLDVAERFVQPLLIGQGWKKAEVRDCELASAEFSDGRLRLASRLDAEISQPASSVMQTRGAKALLVNRDLQNLRRGLCQIAVEADRDALLLDVRGQLDKAPHDLDLLVTALEVMVDAPSAQDEARELLHSAQGFTDLNLLNLRARLLQGPLDRAPLWEQIATQAAAMACETLSYFAETAAGDAWLQAGEAEPALQAFRKVLRIRQDHIPALRGAFAACQSLGDDGESQHYGLRLSRALAVIDPELETQIGETFLRQHDLEGARRAFRRALRQGDQPWALLGLAKIAQVQGDLLRAVSLLADAAQSAEQGHQVPALLQALRLRATLQLGALSDPSGALRSTELALVAKVEDFALLWIGAEAAGQLNELQAERVFLQRAEPLVSDEALRSVLAAKLGLVLLKQKQETAAEPYLQMALVTDWLQAPNPVPGLRDDSTWQTNLRVLMAQAEEALLERRATQGDLAPLAEIKLRKAAEAQSGRIQAEFFFEAGQAFWKMGQAGAAVDALTQSMQASPTLPAALLATEIARTKRDPEALFSALTASLKLLDESPAHLDDQVAFRIELAKLASADPISQVGSAARLLQEAWARNATPALGMDLAKAQQSTGMLEAARTTLVDVLALEDADFAGLAATALRDLASQMGDEQGLELALAYLETQGDANAAEQLDALFAAQGKTAALIARLRQRGGRAALRRAAELAWQEDQDLDQLRTLLVALQEIPKTDSDDFADWLHNLIATAPQRLQIAVLFMVADIATDMAMRRRSLLRLEEIFRSSEDSSKEAIAVRTLLLDEGCEDLDVWRRQRQSLYDQSQLQDAAGVAAGLSMLVLSQSAPSPALAIEHRVAAELALEAEQPLAAVSLFGRYLEDLEQRLGDDDSTLPELVDTLLKVAEINQRQGQFEEAVQSLIKAQLRCKNSIRQVEILKRIAFLEESCLAQPQSAAEVLERVVRMRPEDQEAATQLSKLYEFLGKGDLLVELHLRMADQLEAGGQRAALLIVAGDVLCDLDPPRALRAYHAAMDAAPDSDLGLSRIVQLSQRSSAYGSLTRAYLHAARLRQGPDRAQMLEEAGAVLGGLMMRSRCAAVVLWQAVRLQPSKPGAIQALIEVARATRQFDFAAKLLERLIEHPQISDGWRVEAILALADNRAMADGDLRHARALYQQALSFDPNHRRALGALLASLDPDEDAALYAQTVNRLLPLLPEESALSLRCSAIDVLAEFLPAASQDLLHGCSVTLLSLTQLSRMAEVATRLGEREILFEINAERLQREPATKDLLRSQRQLAHVVNSDPEVLLALQAQLVQLAPDDGAERLQLAQQLARQQSFADAAEQLDLLLAAMERQADPELWWQAMDLRARCAERLGDDEIAADLLLQLCAADSQAQSQGLRLAKVLQQLGQAEKAATWYDWAAGLMPELQDRRYARLQAAQLWAESGAIAQAAKCYFNLAQDDAAFWPQAFVAAQQSRDQDLLWQVEQGWAAIEPPDDGGAARAVEVATAALKQRDLVWAPRWIAHLLERDLPSQSLWPLYKLARQNGFGDLCRDLRDRLLADSQFPAADRANLLQDAIASAAIPLARQQLPALLQELQTHDDEDLRLQALSLQLVIDRVGLAKNHAELLQDVHTALAGDASQGALLQQRLYLQALFAQDRVTARALLWQLSRRRQGDAWMPVDQADQALAQLLRLGPQDQNDLVWSDEVEAWLKKQLSQNQEHQAWSAQARDFVAQGFGPERIAQLLVQHAHDLSADDVDRALEVFQQAQAWSALEPEEWARWIDLLERQERFAEAAQLFEQRADNCADATQRRALLSSAAELWRDGAEDDKQALRVFWALFQEQPHSRVLMASCAELLEACGRYAEQADLLRQSAAQTQGIERRELLRRAAMIAEEDAADVDTALAIVEEALAIAPEDPDLHAQQLRLLRAKAQSPQALDQWMDLARVELAHGAVAKANEALMRALAEAEPAHSQRSLNQVLETLLRGGQASALWRLAQDDHALWSRFEQVLTLLPLELSQAAIVHGCAVAYQNNNADFASAMIERLFASEQVLGPAALLALKSLRSQVADAWLTALKAESPLAQQRLLDLWLMGLADETRRQSSLFALAQSNLLSAHERRDLALALQHLPEPHSSGPHLQGQHWPGQQSLMASTLDLLEGDSQFESLSQNLSSLGLLKRLQGPWELSLVQLQDQAWSLLQQGRLAAALQRLLAVALQDEDQGEEIVGSLREYGQDLSLRFVRLWQREADCRRQLVPHFLVASDLVQRRGDFLAAAKIVDRCRGVRPDFVIDDNLQRALDAREGQAEALAKCLETQIAVATAQDENCLALKQQLLALYAGPLQDAALAQGARQQLFEQGALVAEQALLLGQNYRQQGLLEEARRVLRTTLAELTPRPRPDQGPLITELLRVLRSLDDDGVTAEIGPLLIQCGFKMDESKADLSAAQNWQTNLLQALRLRTHTGQQETQAWIDLGEQGRSEDQDRPGNQVRLALSAAECALLQGEGDDRLERLQALYVKYGRYDRLIDSYAFELEQFAPDDDKRVSLHFNLANLLLEHGQRHKLARYHLNRAAQLSPDDTMILRTRVDVERRFGDKSSLAKSLVDLAVQSRSQIAAQCWVEAAQLYRDSHAQKALHYFKKAVQSQDNHFAAQQGYGDLLAAQGQKTKAAEHWLRAADLCQDIDPAIALWLQGARVFEEQGLHLDRAQEAYRKAAKHGNLIALAAAERVARNRDDLEGLEQILGQRALTTESSILRRDLSLERIALLQKLERGTEAVLIADKLVQHLPYDPVVVEKIGDLYASWRRPRQAVELLEGALNSGRLDAAFLLGLRKKLLGLRVVLGDLAGAAMQAKLLVEAGEGDETGRTVIEAQAREEGDASTLREILQQRLALSHSTSEKAALHSELSQLCAKTMDAPQAALDHALEAFACAPDRWSIIEQAIDQCTALEDFDNLAQVLERAVRYTSDDKSRAKLFLQRAQLALTRHEPLALLVQNAKQALALDPLHRAMQRDVFAVAEAIKDRDLAALAAEKLLAQRDLDDPQKSLWRLRVAQAMFAKGQKKPATKALYKLLDDDESFAKGYLVLWEMLAQDPNRQAFLSVAKKGLQVLRDESVRTPLALVAAELLHEGKDPRAAQQLVDEILQKDPTQIKALERSRELAVDCGKFSSFAAQLERAVEHLAPSALRLEYLWELVGLYSERLLDESSATQTLERVLVVSPEDLLARIQLAELRFHANDYARAAALLTVMPQALVDSRRNDLLWMRAQCRREIGEAAGFVADASEIINTVSADHPAWEGLAEHFIANKQTSEALQLVQRWRAIGGLSEAGQQVKWLILEAQYNASQGDRAQSIALYQKVLSEQPDHRQALLALAELLKEDDERSALRGEILRRLAPFQATGHAQAEMYCDSAEQSLLDQDLSTALRTYQQAVEADQDDMRALVGLTETALQRKDGARFVDAAKRLFARDPKWQGAPQLHLSFAEALSVVEPNSTLIAQQIDLSTPDETAERALLLRALALVTSTDDAARQVRLQGLLLRTAVDSDEVWERGRAAGFLARDRLHDGKMAIGFLYRAHASRPDDLEIKKALAELYAQDELSAKEAISAYRQLVAETPEDLDVLEPLAKLLARPEDAAQQRLVVELRDWIAGALADPIQSPQVAISGPLTLHQLTPPRWPQKTHQLIRALGTTVQEIIDVKDAKTLKPQNLDPQVVGMIEPVLAQLDKLIPGPPLQVAAQHESGWNLSIVTRSVLLGPDVLQQGPMGVIGVLGEAVARLRLHTDLAHSRDLAQVEATIGLVCQQLQLAHPFNIATDTIGPLQHASHKILDSARCDKIRAMLPEALGNCSDLVFEDWVRAARQVSARVTFAASGSVLWALAAMLGSRPSTLLRMDAAARKRVMQLVDSKVLIRFVLGETIALLAGPAVQE